MVKSTIGMLALLAGLGAAAPALASSNGLIEKLTPENVGAALDALGLPYSVEPDPRGYPMILVNPKPFPVQQFNIMFFACDTVSVECEDVTLWAWYDVGGRVSPDVINIWNDPFQGARRWSTGYLDQEDDPALIMNINATGGIGERALQILVNTYIEDIFAFEEALENGGKVAESQVDREDVSARALVDREVVRLTTLVKDFGGTSFGQTKRTDKKH